MIGGNTNVAGTVNNSVVVVNGDVHVQSSAHIKGVIVVIGGQLEQEEGADVTNDVVSISFDDATVNSLLIGSGLIFGIGALKLASSLIMIILPVLMVAFGKKRTAAWVERYQVAPRGKSFSMGFFTGLLLFAISVLLLLTIVGIPFILIPALFIFVALALGLTVVSKVIGEQIRGTGDKPEWVRVGAGAFILVSAINIPFIGLFIFMALILFSLGITTTWMVSLLRRRRKSTNI